MHVRQWVLLVTVLLVVVLLGVLAVPAFGADGAPARACAAATVENVTTYEDPDVSPASVEVAGGGRISGDHEFTGWFEYRTVDAGGDWRTTNRTEVQTDTCGQGWFEATLTELEPHTTYEYRVVVATDNESARGDVETFTTGSMVPTATPTHAETLTTTSTPTRTHTSTPDPCPNFRGAGALCTRTPTPTPTGQPSDVVHEGPARDPGLVEWFRGLVPVVAWVGAMVVLAPLVLGLVLGLDSLHGRR